MKKQLDITDIHNTKPLTDDQRVAMDDLINRTTKANEGDSSSYRFNVGDTVKDSFFGLNAKEMIITECYRENGHNKYATKDGFFRECDLIIIKMAKGDNVQVKKVIQE